VICLLIVKTPTDMKTIKRAVERTLKNKFPQRKVKRDNPGELKGCKTNFSVKQYFWNQISPADFDLYSIVLNKRRINHDLQNAPDRLYNYLARLVIDQIEFKGIKSIIVVMDRCKSKLEILDFNNYLELHLKAVIDPKSSLDINHSLSHEDRGLQAVDMFSWGFYRKYEKTDSSWYKLFCKKIKFETIYLP